MEAAEPPRPSWRGGVKLQMTLSEGQRLCVTALSLTNPAAAAAASQPMVRVWAQVGDQELTIGMVSPEQPAVAVPAPVEIADGEFLLCHDSASSGVRLYCYYLDPSDLGGDGELMIRRRFVQDIEALGMDDEEDEEVHDEFESLTDEDLAERYDSDNGDDEGDEVPQEFEPLTEEDLAEIYDSDKGEYDDDDEEYHQPRKLRSGEAAGEETSSKRRKSIPLVAAPAAIVVPDGKLLGPARFAAVNNTAGFMRSRPPRTGRRRRRARWGAKRSPCCTGTPASRGRGAGGAAWRRAGGRSFTGSGSPSRPPATWRARWRGRALRCPRSSTLASSAVSSGTCGRALRRRSWMLPPSRRK